jgi:L-amino acid N-acyltransferase YncA
MIRPARVEDAAAIARVSVDVWRTTYKGIVPAAHLANLSYQRREQMWMNAWAQSERRNFIAVALNDQDEVVGFINGGPQRDARDNAFVAELYAIYLLDHYHGNGLGRRLTQALASYLVAQNLCSMTVVVLADNPACQFYQALGAQYVRSQDVEIGGVTLLEQVYGWPDIHPLAE